MMVCAQSVNSLDAAGPERPEQSGLGAAACGLNARVLAEGSHRTGPAGAGRGPSASAERCGVPGLLNVGRGRTKDGTVSTSPWHIGWHHHRPPQVPRDVPRSTGLCNDLAAIRSGSVTPPCLPTPGVPPGNHTWGDRPAPIACGWTIGLL